MLLPGWNSLETVSKLYRFFEIASVSTLALLVIADICALKYGHRKEELQDQQHQREISERDEQTQRELFERDRRIAELEEVQPARFFSDEKQRSILIEELRQIAQDKTFWGQGGRGRIGIYWRRAAETQSYADQIAKAFREAGWHVPNFETLEYSSPLPFRGIHCITRRISPSVCTELISAFSKAGIKVDIGELTFMPADVQRTWMGVGLLIGPK